MPDPRPPQAHTGRGRGVEPLPAFDYLGGDQFGLLTFVGETESRAIDRQDGQRFIRLGLFNCACGQTHIAELRNVKRGLTTSCGCQGALKPSRCAPAQEDRMATHTTTTYSCDRCGADMGENEHPTEKRIEVSARDRMVIRPTRGVEWSHLCEPCTTAVLAFFWPDDPNG